MDHTQRVIFSPREVAGRADHCPDGRQSTRNPEAKRCAVMIGMGLRLLHLCLERSAVYRPLKLSGRQNISALWE